MTLRVGVEGLLDIVVAFLLTINQDGVCLIINILYYY